MGEALDGCGGGGGGGEWDLRAGEPVTEGAFSTTAASSADWAEPGVAVVR